mgnify:FL=1|tara:strand:- start:442 stop:1356 length:915 start_codon:yes stop_codon:yes gene_type:complete
MTVVQPNSISGITSLTCSSDTLSIHKSDGSLIRNLTSSGIVTCTKLEVSPGTGSTFFENGNVVVAGILTVPTIGNATDTLTIPGNLTVQGTRTIINTDELNVRDKLVGIGSTATPSTLSQDGSGIIIYGKHNVDLKYEVSKAAIGVNTAFCVSGFVTAFGGVRVGSAITLHTNGNLGITGVMTASSYVGDGSGLSGISVGIETSAQTGTNAVVTLDLSKQDHKLTLAGISTIDCQNGTEGDAHTVRIINSGITTVGFSTYFLWPGGGVPVLPTTSGAIHQISFTVHHVGAAGTQLLAGASLNYS